MRLQRIIEGELNKLLIFELKDRFAVESVFYRGDTLCVSTQVGCGVRCSFCASGRNGLLRNLSSEEIYGQYSIARELFPIKKIAIAGIGEPLANWGNVKKAFWKFREEGLKVSFYTVGYPLSNLRELIHLPHNGVSISVHSFDRDIRKRLMPYSGDIEKLRFFLREELPRLSPKKRKKIAIAYLLLKGLNDSHGELVELGKFARSLGVGVVLLYYNQVDSFIPPTEKEYEEAFLFLRSMGVRVTLSTRFRKDKIGGCGTLTANRGIDTYTQEVIA